MLMLTTSLIFLICGGAYIYLKKRYKYWKELGIPGPEPEMVVGNMRDVLSLKSTEPAMMQKWYDEYRNEPFIGYYNLWKPTLFVIDTELIRAVTEVDFNHFIDHPKMITDHEYDSVLDSLFTMNGAEWKAKRQIFSKLFSPKKLKELANITDQENIKLVNEIDQSLKTSDEIELMGITERQILRTIISFMFSIEPSQNQELYSKLTELSETFARPPGSVVFRFLFFSGFPNLFMKLKLSTMNSVFWDYFSKFTNDILHSRKEINDQRDDLVTLIRQMQKEGLETEKIDHQEAVGHVFSFFIGSHHTTMTTISYVIYELSRHPEVQEKLQKEVDSVLNGKESISYDALKQMTYLDAVIDETLRMYPLVGALKRTCTQPFKINDKFTIPKGMDITLPALAVHMDPEYFPEPEKFIPERFLEDKKPTLFMPFGKGPRTCIGKRFAYISMRMIIAKIVSEYLILPSTKTSTPIKFDPKTFIITVHPVDGLYVRLQKREKFNNNTTTS